MNVFFVSYLAPRDLVGRCDIFVAERDDETVGLGFARAEAEHVARAPANPVVDEDVPIFEDRRRFTEHQVNLVLRGFSIDDLVCLFLADLLALANRFIADGVNRDSFHAAPCQQQTQGTGGNN